ncbi:MULTISPECIES: SAM-dependent methyltransferase [Nocardiopsis]|uniref:SAM-dependent methyltransferase n=1 Tax=Nocardiopsis akebiae TaxID=2831968 RepID=A0ABX8C9A5_9ACTN|nr:MULTISPECIES: SAM-dependent methyltransferase [Nocardiopsis]QUX30627.1 SAM-dependent methyltransferase [Nocardiopsis akebiae]WDZ92820.1 SAM-dependent methyltransferase [Nocardiopsis sp. HUAS JQ3]
MTTPPPIDTSVPHSARVWNYWLGGKDNYPADRALGDLILKDFPEMVDVARAQRTFLLRAVTHLAGEAGIDQFLDLGTGLPTHNNTHEIAQSVNPAARVVYVDNDPLVLAHARALLTGTEQGATDYVDADVHDPEVVLEAASRTLDLTRPVGLTMLGILGHHTHERAVSLVRSYTERLPTGSFLAVADSTDTSEGMRRAAEAWNADAPLPYILRSPEQIGEYFAGLELVEPGVVPALEWRSSQIDVGGTLPTAADEYCGMGRKA